MNLRLIRTLYSNKKSSVFRNQNLINMLIIGIKLKFGEFFGSIYIKQKTARKDILDLPMLKNSIQEFDSIIRNTLEKQQIKNTIDFEKKGIENIGSGCVFVPSIFGHMVAFTQKEGEFYFKIDSTKKVTLKIQFTSIPKISGKIKLEEKIIGEFSLSSFKEKKILVKIDSSLIEQKISKIKISVDKCWNMHHIYELFPNYPLGVGIKHIEILEN